MTTMAHDACVEGQFCKATGKPGPCKGWKRGSRSTEEEGDAAHPAPTKRAPAKAAPRRAPAKAAPGTAAGQRERALGGVNPTKAADAGATIAGLTGAVDNPAAFKADLAARLKAAKTPEQRSQVLTDTASMLGNAMANRAPNASPETRRKLANALKVEIFEALKKGDANRLQGIAQALGNDANDDRAGRVIRAMTASAGDCGCTDEQFAVDVKAAVEAEEVGVDARGNVTRWRSLIAPIGVPTGDGRRFAAGALTHRDLPVALRWHREDEGGHKSVVVVGTVDRIEYTEDGAYASGIIFDPDPAVMPDLAENVAEMRLQLEHKVIGPSVDLDDMEFTVEEPDTEGAQQRPKIEVTKGRISGVTLVQIPAFSETRQVQLSTMTAEEYAAEQEAVVAAGINPALRDLEVWSVPGWTPEGMLARAREGGRALVAACAWSDDGEGRLPVVDEVDGKQVIVAEAVELAVATLVAGGCTEIPEHVRGPLQAELERLLEPEETLLASAGPAAPPSAWFADPGLGGPTPLTVTDEGRVYGHLATWDTCHIGFPGKCVTPPRSRSQYAYFHVGEVVTAEGDALPVGKVTLGGGHADTRLGFQAALEHYDDSGAAAALVRAGEDAYGIWVAGALCPDVDEVKVASLRRSPLSGDWRQVGGRLELVAALAVNTPGFPVPRGRIREGRQVALVAAAVVQPEEEEGDLFSTLMREAGGPDAHTELAVEDIVRATVTQVRRDDRARHLADRMGAAYAASDAAERAQAALARLNGR